MRGALVATTVLGLAITAGAYAEDTFGPVSTPPAAQSFRIGPIKVTALHDAQFVARNDGKILGVDVGPGPVSDVLRAAGEPPDRITLDVNALLVRSGRRVLLLDAGLGPNAHGGLIASLKEAGVAPTAVTDVLITHTHGDHVGGLLDADGHLAFPRATIRMAAPEWAWMQKQGPAELVKTIAVHVETFEPGRSIAPGVTPVNLYGHTPGHVGYRIGGGDSLLLDIGDLAHSSIVSLAKPNWTMGFDSDPAAGKLTREATLAQLAESHELVFAPHFPFPGVGYIDAKGDGFVWRPGIPEAMKGSQSKRTDRRPRELH